MEQKVADTLLEEKQTIVIDQVGSFEMNPPSIATLVLASKYIRQMPSKLLKEESLVSEMINNADKLAPVGKALAAMILGAKEFSKKEKLTIHNFYKKRNTRGSVIAEKINTANVSDVLNSFFDVLKGMKLNDFFQLTTFLIEMNLTKRTKKVVD